MLQPRWIANKWLDTAARTQHETHIDQHTDTTIQQWCRNKGKNEPYYINCGIKIATHTITDTTNIDYRKYQEYSAFIDEQIKIGKTKNKPFHNKDLPY